MGRGTIYPFILEMLLGYVRPGMRVLETGCGGALYREPLIVAGVTYFGVDVPNSHYQDPGDVDVLCSADALPFRRGSIDILFNQGAIDYMRDPALALKEAYRVLRPGGTLLIFTYKREVLEEIHRNCLLSNRPWERNHWVFSREELMELLQAAGFRTKDVSADLDTWSPDSAFKWLTMRLSGKLATQRLTQSHWRAYRGRKGR